MGVFHIRCVMIIELTFPYLYKKKYYNYAREKSHGFFLASLCMFFYSRLKRFRLKKPDARAWIVPYKPSDFSTIPTITWIGHSTFLIQCASIRILTDPIFGDASFLFKRIIQSPITVDDLNHIDYVLLSHNHRDHMDKKSLCALKKYNPVFLVPCGDKQWFDRYNFYTAVHEHTWWQTTHFTIGNDVLSFTFLPTRHWSQRSLFDRNRSLWGSWMIHYKNYTIYFAGDTAYASHFTMIQKKFSSIDVALMPIGPCQPHTWMKHSHINAQQAIKAFLDLNANCFIPMHWGTFYFGTDSFSTPIDHLTYCWNKEPRVADKQLHILKFGQTWHAEEKAQMQTSLSYEKTLSFQ